MFASPKPAANINRLQITEAIIIKLTNRQDTGITGTLKLFSDDRLNQKQNLCNFQNLQATPQERGINSVAEQNIRNKLFGTIRVIMIPAHISSDETEN